MKDSVNEGKTFEEALARLEELVRALENGAQGLDDSLALFEEGVSLVRFCTEKLDTAEQRVKVLIKDGDALVEEDFKPQGT